MNKKEQPIQQATIILPYFDHEVPVLYVEDGTPYIPVIALCDMLGLRAATHIPRWRTLVLWCNARKLPWRTPTGHTRIVWCLHLGALPFWCVCFNWSLVSPERYIQLQQATDEWTKGVEQAQQEMLTHYRHMRRLLFAFLTTYGDAEAKLSQFAIHLHTYLDTDSCIQLEMLISQGCTLINEATAHARKMLRDQASTPIIDVVTIDPEGEVTEVFSLPLFPIVPPQEREQFFEYIRMLTKWYWNLFAFLDEKGLSWNKDHER